MFKLSKAAPALVACLFAVHAHATDTFRDREDPAVVREWNSLAEGVIPASAGPSLPRTYAMMHIAMFDAVAAIAGTHATYTGTTATTKQTSMSAAIGIFSV